MSQIKTSNIYKNHKISVYLTPFSIEILFINDAQKISIIHKIHPVKNTNNKRIRTGKVN